MWIRIIDLALHHDPELLAELLGFPDDLPNLGACRVPTNKSPDGIHESFFARRERGELPSLNLSD